MPCEGVRVVLVSVIGLNASVDRTLVVPGARLGAVMRVEAEHRTAGGKGINVARCLRQLGHEVHLVTVLGGGTGAFVRDALRQMGATVTAVATEGDTRVCDVVLDPAAGHPTVLNTAGPEITTEAWEATDAAVLRRIASPDAGIVVATGSLPPGVPSDAYARWTRAARERGLRFALDASGEALRAACDERPWLVKVNAHELSDAFGPDRPVADIARGLLARGISHVVVTDGPEGARMWSEGGSALRAAPFAHGVVNPIGCGDAMMAGVVSAFAAGGGAEEALRLGTACAAANLAHVTPGLGDASDPEAWAGEVVLEEAPL